MINIRVLPAIFIIYTLMTGVTALADGAATGEATGDDQKVSERAGENYQPDDALSSISAAMEKAAKNRQKLLLIMGANWCHDSRALAARIEKPPLKPIIDEYYQTVFVDVGNLDKGKDVITGFGIPVYYATPTVLIIDPDSGNVVNAGNRHQWGDAANISMEDSVAYFRQMATATPALMNTETGANDELSALLAEIESFEQAQADRVYRAYAELAPMLEAYNKGDRDKFSDKLWNEVRDFRNQVPVDVAALQQEARQRTADGETGIKLKYPKYRGLSWEKKRRK